MVLLNGRREDAIHADAVAPHDGHDFLAVRVEHARAHALRILVAQLEDVADLDGFGNVKRTAAIRTSFALRYVADIGNHRGPKILARRNIAKVIIEFVGAADHVLAALESPVRATTVNPPDIGFSAAIEAPPVPDIPPGP